MDSTYNIRVGRSQSTGQSAGELAHSKRFATTHAGRTIGPKFFAIGDAFDRH